jgi:hypothetical protein
MRDRAGWVTVSPTDWGSDNGRVPGSRLERALSPQIVAEMRTLHEAVVSLEAAAGRMAKLRPPKELREARQAEADLLRALGFTSYLEFLSRVEAAEAGDAAESREADDRATSRAAVDRIEREPAHHPGEDREAGDPGVRAVPRALPPRPVPPAAGTRPPISVVPAPDDGPAPDSMARVVDELADVRDRLVATEAEVRRLRSEVVALLDDLRETTAGATAELQEARTAAQREAEVMRAEAEAEAARLLAAARKQADALLRDAQVTRDGLEALAREAAQQERRAGA